MGYTIKPLYWLKVEANKVEAIILMAENWLKTWTASTLQEYLVGKGLAYTVDQCSAILNELKTRGVLIEE